MGDDKSRWNREARQFARRIEDRHGTTPWRRAIRDAYKPERHETGPSPDWVAVVEQLADGKQTPAEVERAIDENRESVAYGLETLRRLGCVRRAPYRLEGTSRLELVPLYELVHDLDSARRLAENLAAAPPRTETLGRPPAYDADPPEDFSDLEEQFGIDPPAGDGA
jgi:hypothetical protein